MKRKLAILSLYAVMSIAAFGQLTAVKLHQTGCCPACCTDGKCSDDCCAGGKCTDDCCAKAKCADDGCSHADHK